MPELESKTITDFKGMRTDKGKKFIDPSYFFDAKNFNADDLIGANRILFPSIQVDLEGTASIDGITQFEYLDKNNINQSLSVFACNGSLYKNIVGEPAEIIYSGMFSGKCSFATINDQLFVFNGKNYPKVFDGNIVTEMGAPKVSIYEQPGNLTGSYFYEMTYVTAGGEERIGTKSNVINVIGSILKVEIPIGYEGTTSRKIYRTTANGSDPKLLTTIADNTTLYFIDNVPDGSLGADIIPINNECPKPYFAVVFNSRIVGAVSDTNPSQIWVSDSGVPVFDSAKYADVSGINNDTTKIKGIGIDYNFVMIGTERNIYICQPGNPTTITPTRCNVGVKDGYTICQVPANGEFAGGIIFLSSLNDIRLFNGNFAQPVATSLDNLTTENWSQVIKPSLDSAILNSQNFSSIFYDYKYHISIKNVVFVFDIRTQSWFKYQFDLSDDFLNFNSFGVVNGILFGGEFGASIIDKFYSDTSLRGNECISYIQSPELFVSDEFKFFREFVFYFVESDLIDIIVTITVDGDVTNQLVYNVSLNGPSYESSAFLESDFEASYDSEDYRSIPINRRGRWIEFNISSSNNPFFFRGVKVSYETQSN